MIKLECLSPASPIAQFNYYRQVQSQKQINLYYYNYPQRHQKTKKCVTNNGSSLFGQSIIRGEEETLYNITNRP